MTTNLIRIANTTCNGRVVSALEGGYQIRGEFCSSFAKSVKAHVSALCGSVATSNEVKYSTADAEVEMHAEKEVSALYIFTMKMIGIFAGHCPTASEASREASRGG